MQASYFTCDKGLFVRIPDGGQICIVAVTDMSSIDPWLEWVVPKQVAIRPVL